MKEVGDDQLTFSQRFCKSRMRFFLTPSNSASCTLMAFRARSRSCALSARFFPPSMPAEVTANARFRGISAQPPCLSDNPSNVKVTNLKFLVDALQTLNGSVQASDFIGLQFKLLLEIQDLALVGLSLCGVLSFELALGGYQPHFSTVLQHHTFRSATDSVRPTLLVSSSPMVFSVYPPHKSRSKRR